MRYLYNLLTTDGRLLAAHADAYFDLLTAEIEKASSLWMRKTILHALAIFCLLASCLLAGIALMLWAINTEMQSPRLWILLAVPAVPAIASFLFYVTLKYTDKCIAFGILKVQIKADLQMLHNASG